MKKYLNLIGFLILIIIVFSCTIKDFEAPEFDKKIEFPLISQSYYMSDLADSTDDFIIVVENDTMMFSISNEFETKHVTEDDLKIDSQEVTFESEIGDELTIDGRNEQTTVDVGDELVIDGQEREFERYVDRIEVEGTGDAEASILVLDFANDALGGGVGPVVGEQIPPYYDFPPFYQDFGIFANDNLEYVIIDTGTVFITFHNNTDIPLSSDIPDQAFQMHFEFWTNGTAASHPDSIFMFEHYIYPAIGPGDTENMTLPFDGQTVYRENYLKCYLTTDGTSGPINVDEDDSFDVTFSVGNMTVSEASAILEAASVNHEDAISISDEEIQVISAEIATCTGNIHIENNLPIDVDTLIIEFTEMFDPSDIPFRIEQTGLLSGFTYDIPIILDDCLIHSARDNPLDSLHFTLYASTDPPPGYVQITPEDKILTLIEFGEMSFNTVTGIINQESNEDGEIGLEDDTIELQSAAIREGTINISLTGLEIIPPSKVEILFDEIKDPNNNFEPLLLVIDDNFNNYVYDFADHLIEFIPPNQTLHYHTTVILDQLITISNTDIVTADITLSDMIFEQITGKFGSFTIEDESSTVIDSTGEFSLFYAEIHNCEVIIDISQNYTLPFDADINLVFNEIYTQAGIPLEVSFHCPGDTIFNFAGYTVGLDPNSSVSIDTLHYSYSVVTDSTGNNYVPINYDDEVAAIISIGNMVFQQIRGMIDHKRIDMVDIEEDIDLEDLPDNLSDLLVFQIVQLHLSIFNQTGFECNLNMHLEGSNDDGETAELFINETIGAATTTDIIIEEGVNNLLNIIPNNIKVTEIYALIGDGVTSGSITLNDSISGFYEVVTPLQFIITDSISITDRPDPIEMDDDSQEAFEQNINGIRLVMNVENKFPFGADVKVFFATDSALVFENPGLLIDSLFIEPAEIINGFSGDPTISTLTIDLSEGDFNVFLDPEYQVVHIGAELSNMGTNGVIVNVRGSDNIKIIGHLEAEVHIAEPEE